MQNPSTVVAPVKIGMDTSIELGLHPDPRPTKQTPRCQESAATSEEETLVEQIIINIAYALVILTFPISWIFCVNVVQEYERLVVFRLGQCRAGGVQGPGLVIVIPFLDNAFRIDLRTVSFDVPPQEILTKDSVTISVDAVVYFKVNDALISVTNVSCSQRSTRLLAATTLRNVLGMKNLSEVLSEREHISHLMQSTLDEATERWGVQVERVEIKDVRLPTQLQRAMATEAEATREARAKVIAAEGEQRASSALKSAADIISTAPQALQLRYLQTLTHIATEKNSTIVFPLPMEIFSGFQVARALAPMAAGYQAQQQQQQVANAALAGASSQNEKICLEA